MSDLGQTGDLSGDFDAVIEQVTEALKKEGFGVISRIDIDDAFREKIGVEFRRYTILGACNPQLAHRALTSEPQVGLLLPCNICVEATDTGSRVHLVDAANMMSASGLGDNEVIGELGEDAGARLARVAAALEKLAS